MLIALIGFGAKLGWIVSDRYCRSTCNGATVGLSMSN